MWTLLQYVKNGVKFHCQPPVFLLLSPFPRLVPGPTPIEWGWIKTNGVYAPLCVAVHEASSVRRELFLGRRRRLREKMQVQKG